MEFFVQREVHLLQCWAVLPTWMVGTGLAASMHISLARLQFATSSWRSNYPATEARSCAESRSEDCIASSDGAASQTAGAGPRHHRGRVDTARATPARCMDLGCWTLTFSKLCLLRSYLLLPPARACFPLHGAILVEVSAMHISMENV